MDKKFIALIVVVCFISSLIVAELIPQNAPETIYIHVLKSDKVTPETDAYCKADVITDEQNEIELSRVDYMPLDCYKEECANELFHEGFYKLDTGLNNYKGKFEIKIVCMTSTGVSYTILNNTHIPCEIKGNGEEIRCLNADNN